MERLKIGHSELGRLIGQNRQTVKRWADGDRKLSVATAEEIAEKLPGISVSELLIEGWQPARRVPLISWVSAGQIQDVDSITNVDIEDYVNAADLPDGDWIALRVKGDSMDRVAPDGSIIFVNRRERRLQSERFYVVANERGAATFKRYRQGPNNQARFQPFSTNPDHETIFPKEEEMKVIGRVRRVVNDLK